MSQFEDFCFILFLKKNKVLCLYVTFPGNHKHMSLFGVTDKKMVNKLFSGVCLAAASLKSPPKCEWRLTILHPWSFVHKCRHLHERAPPLLGDRWLLYSLGRGPCGLHGFLSLVSLCVTAIFVSLRGLLQPLSFSFSPPSRKKCFNSKEIPMQNTYEVMIMNYTYFIFSIQISICS